MLNKRRMPTTDGTANLEWTRAAAGATKRRGGAARSRRRKIELEQIAMDLGPARPRWTFSRLVLDSPHHERIRERLEFVRRYFPELDGLTIHVGLAQKPGVLGWASLDPDRPGVWVRPRRIDSLTVAHEFTHLLQARKLVPGGERACDLWALARSAHLVDTPPCYLAIPRAWRWRRRLDPEIARFLTEHARRAIAARAHGDRRYLKSFERAVAGGLPKAGPGSPSATRTLFAQLTGLVGGGPAPPVASSDREPDPEVAS